MATPLGTGVNPPSVMTPRGSRLRFGRNRGSSPSPPRGVTIVPPFLDAWGAYHLLAKGLTWRRRKVSDQAEVLGRPEQRTADPMIGGMSEQTPLPRRDTGMILRPQAGGGSCGCSCGGLVGSNPERANDPFTQTSRLGPDRTALPRVSVEKEFAQATGRAGTAGLTDRQVLHAVLSKPENRYLVRQLCWVMTIEGWKPTSWPRATRRTSVCWWRPSSYPSTLGPRLRHRVSRVPSPGRKCATG